MARIGPILIIPAPKIYHFLCPGESLLVILRPLLQVLSGRG